MDAPPGLSQNLAFLPTLSVIYGLLFPSPRTPGCGSTTVGTHLPLDPTTPWSAPRPGGDPGGDRGGTRLVQAP